MGTVPASSSVFSLTPQSLAPCFCHSELVAALQTLSYLQAFYTLFFILGIPSLSLPAHVDSSFSQVITFSRNLCSLLYATMILMFTTVVPLILYFNFSFISLFHTLNQKPSQGKQQDLYAHLTQRCLIHSLVL